MPYPRKWLDQLMLDADIVTVIKKYLPGLKPASWGRRGKIIVEFKTLCPFHREKTASFFVSERKQFYHCFGCGAHGNLFNFLMEHAGLRFSEAVRAVAKMQGKKLPHKNKGWQKIKK